MLSNARDLVMPQAFAADMLSWLGEVLIVALGPSLLLALATLHRACIAHGSFSTRQVCEWLPGCSLHAVWWWQPILRPRLSLLWERPRHEATRLGE
jgi:hypothetical protein